MEPDSLFTQEIVREFISANGGKVTNPVLISHFKNFLNDPIRKVANRQQFKTYINTLATIKLDESGTKVLVLKKKFRGGFDDSTPVKTTTEQFYKPPVKLKTENDDSLLSENECTKEETESSIPSEVPQTISDESQPSLEIPQTSSNEPLPQTSTEDQRSSDETEIQPDETEIQPDETEIQPEETISHETDCDNSQEIQDDVARTHVAVVEASGESSVFEETSTEKGDNTNLKEPEIDEAKEESFYKDEVAFVSQGMNIAKDYFLADDESNKKDGSFEEAFKSELLQENKMESHVEGAKASEHKGVSSEVRVLRVKDAAMNIDKMEHEKATTHQLKVASHQQQPKGKREPRKPLGSDTSSTIDSEPPNMTDLDREWLMMSSASDFQSMSKMLQSSPHLASRRDFITGYNALHWACKNGNSDVVKLLCGKYSVDPNVRTSGGYTSLHLAATMNHEDVMELLVKVYKADNLVRDYSGRQVKHYLSTSASKRSLHLVLPRKGNNTNYLATNRQASYQGFPTDKENTLPASPVSTKPFRPEDYSVLMPPPTKLPPVKRRPTSINAKAAHSDSETAEEQLTLNSSISGSTPNFETVV